MFWLAAAKKASTKPKSVFGAWYTMMFEGAARAPDCSTSRVVSPEPDASLIGPDPPSTLSRVIRLALVLMPRTLSQKNSVVAGSTLASVTMPIVASAPVAPSLYSGLRVYWLGEGLRGPVPGRGGAVPPAVVGCGGVV